jgi:hypothetical protein
VGNIASFPLSGKYTQPVSAQSPTLARNRPALRQLLDASSLTLAS